MQSDVAIISPLGLRGSVDECRTILFKDKSKAIVKAMDK